VKRLALVLFMIVSSPPGMAWAQVARFPTGLNVSVLRPSAININWILTGAAGGTGTSRVGLFQPTDPGAVPGACTTATAIGRVDTTIRTDISPLGNGRAVETLVIPSTVADLALKRGLNQFFYCRVFTGTFGPAASNSVTCRQGSSAFANFSIARVEMFFENQRREITVPIGQPNLRVFADVAYNGSGILRAVWEVAEPSVGSQGPLFRTLHVINQYVPFGDRVLLTLPGAPPLPASQPGEYTVNLRIIEPPVGFTIPTGRYFVESREHQQRVQPIALREPREAAVLALRPFDFHWAAIPKIAQYRLDVYPRETVTQPTAPGLVQGPATNPSTDASAFLRAPRELGTPTAAALSVLIPSQVTTFTLRHAQLARLTAGRAYLWQIKGLDQQGAVVAESPLRHFTLQAR